MSPEDLGSIAGLPEELGVGEDLARSEQLLRIRVDTRRYGKSMTIVEGFDPKFVDVGEMATKLKKRVATGGTSQGDRVELQGDHRKRLPEILEEMGFEVEE